ncbi:hypothetical protein KFL_005990010 [Klebsormidium nitens]|uniref:Uncharacterized protein n=1 Tax=Klebsormidium nitens TaxID=105231 RepID=A0A1Y1IGT9_KLENI|nr:hypothetical protein KFL_005990010 [Klebsormidium nitens]|eukprot:GAQ90094.1 hypothetical protein KFL_005990010 [Klebsormidium nitens]
MQAVERCSALAHGAPTLFARPHGIADNLPHIPCSISEYKVRPSSRRAARLRVSAVSKEGLEKVQRAISQAQSEDKRKPGIPPPPLDAGPGLINLSGRDDLETRRAPFVKPLSTPPAEPLTPPEPVSSQKPADGPSVSGKEEGKESWLLPSPLTPGQRVIVLEMIGLTVVAFGRSSEGVVPEEVLGFLQLWMRLAWGGHAFLGVVAAVLAAGKGRTPLKWFVKVAASGALGLQELLALPKRS